MNFFKKDNEIIFFHNEPSITDLFPIVESKELKLNWPNKLRQDLKNRVKKDTELDMYYNHVSRCPGIFDLFKYGYVVSLHKDIIIKPKGKEFDYVLPTKPHRDRTFAISWQSGNLIAKPPWAANFIIKIETGWNVIAPKGIKFIMLPIAYPDSFEFTSTIGILDPSIATDINFQMFWNEKEDTIIKAGTPLGQLIPLSDKTFKMIQRNMNEKDLYWISKLKSAYNTGFWNYTIRKKVVDMYNKYWN